MFMIKAFAYGMGDLQMASFLSTCDIDLLGVSCMDEAISLRRAGISLPIFVIHVPLYEILKALKWDVEIGIDAEETLLAIEALAPKKPLKVHLHIDTGMKRFGIAPENGLSLAKKLENSPYIDFTGIMTHLSCAEDPEEDVFTLEQLTKFNAVISILQKNDINPPWKHAANSAGVLRFNWSEYSMVRIGLAAYGLHNSEATKTLPLKPAISLEAHVIALNTCKKGESIGYNRQYFAKRENELIAILSIGYHDGLHRIYSGKGSVLIRGKKAPIVGNICMDFMMVDVTDIPNVSVGDLALIFGNGENGSYLPPEEITRASGSIVHELISCLGPRIQRIFITSFTYRLTEYDLKL